MSKQLSAVARQYVSAVEALASAEKAVAVAKELLSEAYAEAGVNSWEANDKCVQLVEAIRRNFDVATLSELVNAKVFGAVTKTAVEPKAFDKARKAGDISEEVETACVKPTPYTRIVIRDLAEGASTETAHAV
jgi:nicotinamide mononucleotide adenylyltransferase